MLVPYSNFQHCNWLQVQDNAADNYHTMALHAKRQVTGQNYQGTTFDAVGAASMEVPPDMHFVPVHGGRGLACAGARRSDDEHMYIRVQHQVLPNLSLHAYTSEDGHAKKLFGRFHMIRWTVPVDDQNAKMLGWRVMGPGIDTRGIGDKSLVGYESIDFLEGQVAMRRPERFGQYKLEDLPPIPADHRARAHYKDCQYAPGDYEAIVSQRPIAVHALENPTKFDAGLFIFRKLLRDAVRGANPKAGPEEFAQWLRGRAQQLLLGQRVRAAAGPQHRRRGDTAPPSRAPGRGHPRAGRGAQGRRADCVREGQDGSVAAGRAGQQRLRRT